MRTRLGTLLILSALMAPAWAADVQLDTEANPSTPASGSAVGFFNSTNKEWQSIDDGGSVKTIRPLTNTGSTTTAGADIYIVGSNISVPPQLVRVGSTFRWRLNVSKTAAGTAAPIYNIRVGTAGAIGDTAVLTFTQASAQTAATDNGVIDIFCVVTTAGSSGIINGGYMLEHTGNGAAASAGFASVMMQEQGPTASSTVNLSTANLVFGLSINPGASGVWTIQTYAEGLNL